MRGEQADPSSPSRDLFVGLRGVLTRREGAAPQPEWAELAPDPYSLAAELGELLGLSLIDEAYASENLWDHLDAGGDWSAPGDALLIWLQMGLVRNGGHARSVVPIQLGALVAQHVLERVGDAAVGEVDVSVEAASLTRSTASRLRAGWPWFALNRHGVAPVGVAIDVDLDSGASPPRTLSQTILAHLRQHERIVWQSSDLSGTPGRRPVRHERFPQGVFTGGLVRDGMSGERAAGVVQVGCQATCWSVHLGAWLAEIVAHACVAAGAEGRLAIGVRRVP